MVGSGAGRKLKLKAERESIFIFQVYMPTSEYENEVMENFMIQAKTLNRMKKVRQAPS